ncbi:MAG: acetylxylan esterase [Dysgonamonadaceae bacterium]|jgi:hypothetical protein|nr:acetylxylan esterase [Dysgonamonadaceae bacterium]
MTKISQILAILFVWIFCFPQIHAQDSTVQYFAPNPDVKKLFVLKCNEAAIPEYELPDPLTTNNGKQVTSTSMWWRQRRSEILSQFENEMYGRIPVFINTCEKQIFRVEVINEKHDALNGKATRREVRLYFSKNTDSPYLDVLLYFPNKIKIPVPTFVMLNFRGNQSVTDEPDVRICTSWMTPREDGTVEYFRSVESSRGVAGSRWPIEMIIDRGYALATACYQDIDPDYDDDFQNGIHPLFYKKKQKRPADNEWGSIGAWAWGLSRILDYLESESRVHPGQIVVAGHSRLGKAALWAGAQDQRFAVVIANNSGCGGGALSKRVFGETVDLLCYVRPHWFCRNFRYYAGNEKDLAFDQHELIALIAPRPIYLSTAVEDKVADPKGELLSLINADPVYRLLGTDGIGNFIGKYILQEKKNRIYDVKMPAINHSIGATIGFHIRSGGHDITSFDWEQFLNFTDRHFHK